MQIVKILRRKYSYLYDVIFGFMLLPYTYSF